MVIKTDELPAAAPADSAREHGSQAGGKGRPGAAGELGRGLRAAGRGAPVRGGGFGTPRGPPPSLRGGPGCISLGPLPGRPRAEGHLHCRPRLRPGLRTWGPGEDSLSGHTRASSQGHVRAHAVSGCAAAADRGNRRPHPLCARELSGLGSL
ncbi:hypothetical protein AAY473_032613 [Plecturocebus cupreus]